jgi:hypothetical protein
MRRQFREWEEESRDPSPRGAAADAVARRLALPDAPVSAAAGRSGGGAAAAAVTAAAVLLPLLLA